MRALRFFVAMAGVSTLAFAGACSRTEPAPGVLMLAVQTDLAAGKTKDIQAVGLYVRDLDRNRTLFQLTEPVAPDGTVKFPATLAIVGRNNPGASVRIRIVGFRSGEAQVMREAVTTIPRDRVALLSLPLRWVNYGKATGKMPPGGAGPSLSPLAGEAVDDASDPFGIVFNVDPSCKGETTYIDGACAPWFVDSDKLPDFVEANVFGGGTANGGGACFDTEKCFSTSTPLAFDTSTCLAPRPAGDFTLGVKLPPGSSGACAGDGCFIPLDPENDEGWKTDPSGAIKLSQGTCDRVAHGHFAIVATTTCGSKAALAPLCGEASTVGPGTDLPSSSDGGDAGDAADGKVETLPDGGPIVPVTLAAAATPTALALDGNDLYYTTLDAKLWRLSASGPANQNPQLVKDFGSDAGVVRADVRLAASGGRVVVVTEGDVHVVDANGNVVSYAMGGYPPRVGRGAALSASAVFFAHGSGGSGGGGVFKCPPGGCVAGISPEATVQQYYDGVVRGLAYDPSSNALFTNVADGTICASGSVCLMRVMANGTPNDAKTPVVSTGLSFLGVTNISVEPAAFGNVYFTVGHDDVKQAGANDTIAVVSKSANNGTALPFTTDQMTARVPGDIRIQHQLANDSKFLFWTSSPGSVLAKSITAPATSTQTTTIAIESGARAIAVDGTSIYWTTALPGGAIRRMARAGVAFK
jgi:hypothetical protein